MTKILHIDDELDHLNLTRIYLKAEKPEYEIDIAETSSRALDLVRENEYECILLDYVMPEMNGINLAMEII